MSKVVIRPKNILKQAVVEIRDPQVLELYDNNDNLIAVLTQLFNDNLWGMVTKGDPDFNTTLVQLGLAKIIPDTTLKKVMSEKNIDNLIIKPGEH